MELKDYGLGDIADWSSLVFARVMPRAKVLAEGEKDGTSHLPLGYVFVIDPKFGSRAKYKLPAGHKKKDAAGVGGEGEPDKTPLDTAVREFDGETGINAKPQAFTYVGKWLGWRKDHWKLLFVADITEGDRDWMNDHHRENEGEKPTFFTVEEFYAMVQDGKMLPEHYEKLVEYALILPLGRDKQTATA